MPQDNTDRFPLIHRPVPIGAMELKRPPLSHVCPKCHCEQVIILPPYAGQIVWACRCGFHNSLDFRKAAEDIPDARIAVKLGRPPVENTCDDCGAVDFIYLPELGGDLRWQCSCGAVWLMRWRPEGGMRSCVRHSPKPAEALKPKIILPNLCNCGLPGCPHCSPGTKAR